MPGPSYRLDRRFLGRLWRLARPFFLRSPQRGRALGLLALLLVLLVAYTKFSVAFNEQSGEFTSALAARDADRFWHSILVFFGLLVIAVPIDAWYYYVRDTLGLRWRRWMTEQFLGRYLDHRAYYRLLNQPDIDNPDQRIADDIYSFTNQSLAFVLVFANAAFQLVAFSRVLWNISSGLVLFLFLYAALVTVVALKVFGQRIVRLNAIGRQREADFRFNLVRLRENAEAIAFYQGEHQEQRRLRHLFGKVFENATRIIRWSLGVNAFYYGNGYLALVLPTLIVAPHVLSGELEVGRIVQATGAFSAVLGALTILVDNMESLSRFAASVGRLETFRESLAARHLTARQEVTVEEHGHVRFDRLSLHTPDGGERVIVRDLSAEVAPGASLLIVGPSGTGKSSLLRAIAGLWEGGAGRLLRPPLDDLLFLPQQPYLPVGSLRVQLCYPRLDREVSDDELQAVLELVRLPKLAERAGGLDAEIDLSRILSMGERQRLALARVFLTKPKYALLDEATSALDPENEELLYAALAKLDGTTLVSISHHRSLVEYHRQVLELQPEGQWRLYSAEQFRSDRVAIG